MSWATALLICLALLFSGCGGDSEDSSTTTTSTQTQSAEASIEGFGAEAEGDEREELLATFHGYLGSLASEDEATACSHLAERVQESLEQFAGKAKKSLSCPQLLSALLSAGADKIAKGQDEGQITKLRIEGDTAFVIFHAPGARLYQLNLAKEGEEWKVASLSASVLAPELPH